MRDSYLALGALALRDRLPFGLLEASRRSCLGLPSFPELAALGSLRRPQLRAQCAESAQHYDVLVEIPGVAKEALTVKILENTLRLEVVGKPAAEAQKEGAPPAEIPEPPLGWTLSFSEELADEGHEAHLENGVLTLKLIKRVPPASKEITLAIQ